MPPESIACPSEGNIAEMLTNAATAFLALVGRDDAGRPAIKVQKREYWYAHRLPDGHELGVSRPKDVPCAPMTSQQRWSEVAELTEVATLRALLAPYQHQLLPYMGNKPRSEVIDAWFVHDAVGHIVDEVWHGNDLEAAARQVAADVHAAIGGQPTIATARALLWDFDIPGQDQMRLDDEYILKRLTEGERQGVTSSFEPFHSKDRFERIRWAIECRVPHAPGDHEYHSTPRQAFDAIVVLLRLVTEAGVAYDSVDFKTEFWQRSPHCQVIIRRPWFVLHRAATLAEPQAETLKALWTAFNAAGGTRGKGTAALRVAMSRLLDAEMKDSREDQLIDLFIAMEAITVPQDVKETIGHRFAVHGALLVEDEPSKRPDVKKKLKAAYKDRSNLVHGLTYDEVTTSVEEATEWAWQSLTRILQNLQHHSHKQQLEALDEYLLVAAGAQPFEEFLTARV